MLHIIKRKVQIVRSQFWNVTYEEAGKRFESSQMKHERICEFEENQQNQRVQKASIAYLSFKWKTDPHAYLITMK